MTTTYDSKQYYADGGFYSEISSISDSVELYISFENALNEDIRYIESSITDEMISEHFKSISPIKLTATVKGTGLSFSRDSYQNKYTTTLSEIPVDSVADELLLLYPYNLNVNTAGNSYTVEVKLESDSFDTITSKYEFTVENLETKSANEHIDFALNNGDYINSKRNAYGETMVQLKDDDEYKWSKYSSLDFENYYEVVFADILIEVMGVSQIGHISLVPVIKEWVGNYKTILREVTTIVENDYTGYLDVTENSIDKILKKSKYETDGMNVDDELRDLVVMKLKEKVSIDKINSAFAKIDKTQQYYGLVKLSANITNDIADFIDGVSILNSYKEMDDNFKAVINNLYNQIPDYESKLKDAVYHYVNVDSYLGYTEEFLNEVKDMALDISIDVFNSVFKKQIISSLCKCIGNITLKSGALLSSTTAFSTISTGLGAVATGATLGVCISDILCNNSGKSEEMSKVVAMSEFSPYIVNTLVNYENALYNFVNDEAVAKFEYAFTMHKAAQCYIMQHTVRSLEIKRDSIIIKIFNRDDWDGLISDILNQKRALENLKCHNDNPDSTIVTETKVVAIKCPVDVFIYDENGNLVVNITNNIKEFVAEGIFVFVGDSEKYVALPADQEYTVKIIATGSGTMDYIVTEYREGSEIVQTIKNLDIPLKPEKEFTGKINSEIGANPNEYILTDNSYSVLIQSPSRTEIRCKDGIVLHANVEGTLPEGAKIVWSTSNNKFKTKQIDADSFQIISNNDGYTTVTVSIVDADGNVLASDGIEMRSKAGFGDKIGGFFRSLFGATKIYDK